MTAMAVPAEEADEATEAWLKGLFEPGKTGGGGGGGGGATRPEYAVLVFYRGLW